MSQAANSNQRTQRGPRSAEWTFVAVGLLGGLLLGGVLLRGGPSADKAARAPTTIPTRATAAAQRAPANDAEIDALKLRLAELEKKRLAERIAALEQETEGEATDESGSSVQESLDRGETDQDGFAARGAAPSPAVEARSPKQRSHGQATLDYWGALNDVIARESAMRTAPGSVTAANAGGFVESRLQAGRFAATAIRDLDASGVDPEAVALGCELISWYQEEVAQNEKAKSLLGSSDIAARKGAAGNAWRSGEEQHRRKCEEINNHGAELRTRLSRRYGLSFPALN